MSDLAAILTVIGATFNLIALLLLAFGQMNLRDEIERLNRRLDGPDDDGGMRTRPRLTF